ncbi:hypothetical protein O8C89_05380 [Aliarcobacter butzleri]|uniref:hypothetical protein n=1 Tax=Aliarcobacter butzleri TaxID=28197 RepID=UPI00263E9921|nr:hypothetical protein [Aliarcobacter butzleri]MDN5079946.1 hypothetical protein [Aliarcobacter butzleri]
MKEIIVTAWNNGNSIYGIRISKKDTKLFEQYNKIYVEIDNEIVEIKKTKGFDKKCPELRHHKIKIFFEKHNLINWERGKPHKFKLIQKEDNKFNLIRF